LIKTKSEIYFAFLDDTLRKLDFSNNLPINLPKSKYILLKLEDVIGFRDKKIDPYKQPLEKFNLISVLDISPKSIYVKYETIIGAKILSQKTIIEEGDVLFSGINPRKNRVAIAPKNESGYPLIGSTEFFASYPLYPAEHEKYVYPKFLALFLKTNFARVQMLNKRSGMAPSRARISDDSFSNVKIPLPTPKEQLKILSEIEKQEQEIEGLRNEFQKEHKSFIELNKNWGKIKMPRINNVNYFSVDADELHNRQDFIANNPEIKKGIAYIKSQQNIRLNDLLEEDFEYGINDYGKEKGKIPFINIENLSALGKVNFIGVRYLSKCDESKLLHEGDILISRSRNVGVCALYDSNQKATFGSYILRGKIKGINPKYLVYFINSEFGALQILYLKTGSTGSNINPKQLQQITILKDAHEDEIIQTFSETIVELEKVKNSLKMKEGSMIKTFESLLVN